MKKAVQIAVAVVGALVSGAIVVLFAANVPPALLPFLAFILIPPISLWLGGLRGIPFCFVTASEYAALAGLQRLTGSAAQPTAVEQLSTAALVALACGAVVQLWMMSRPRSKTRV